MKEMSCPPKTKAKYAVGFLFFFFQYDIVRGSNSPLLSELLMQYMPPTMKVPARTKVKYTPDYEYI